jgi:hypothetical protein
VVFFYVFGQAPLFLIVLLAIMVYLAFIEVYREDMTWQWKLWWVLFVFLLNFVGLIILRIYMIVRKRRQTASD